MIGPGPFKSHNLPDVDTGELQPVTGSHVLPFLEENHAKILKSARYRLGLPPAGSPLYPLDSKCRMVSGETAEAFARSAMPMPTNTRPAAIRRPVIILDGSLISAPKKPRI